MVTKADALLSLYPTAQWVLRDDVLDWLDENIPCPTDEQIENEIVRLQLLEPLEACKKQASTLLYETDWTTMPDVANPSNSPYLINQAEFIEWRNQIRKLAVNPISDPIFPPKPTEIWG